jgi:hypothetical protein
MEIDRLDNADGKLQTWAGNGAFGPKGGVIDGISVIGDRVFANTLVTNKIFAAAIGTDGKAGAISEVTLSRPIDQPDGMRSFGGKSLLVVESGGPGRLAHVKIDGNLGDVTTLKEGFPDGPVSVAVVGSTGFVLEGQLKDLFGSAGPNPNPVVRPYRATAVGLGNP